MRARIERPINITIECFFQAGVNVMNIGAEGKVVSQLAAKLLHFYLATGSLPKRGTKEAANPHLAKAINLLMQNGYLSQAATLDYAQ